MEQMMEYVPNMYATFWALVPPLVAIILALVTKEVYSSLFIGIVIGGLFYGNIFQQGFSFENRYCTFLKTDWSAFYQTRITSAF